MVVIVMRLVVEFNVNVKGVVVDVDYVLEFVVW